LLEEHDRLWAKLDFDGVAGLWDKNEGWAIYIGDEYPSPVVGWEELGQHWGRVGGRLHEAHVRSNLLVAHRLRADIAVAVFLTSFNLVAVESPVEHVGQRWNTAVLRLRKGRWLFVHHAESPAYDVDLSASEQGHKNKETL
jgi:hypothetical protein